MHKVDKWHCKNLYFIYKIINYSNRAVTLTDGSGIYFAWSILDTDFHKLIGRNYTQQHWLAYCIT